MLKNDDSIPIFCFWTCYVVIKEYENLKLEPQMRSEPVVQDLRLGKTKPSSAEKPLIGKENLAPKVVFDESLAARKESFGEEIIPQIKVKKKQLDAFSFIS